MRLVVVGGDLNFDDGAHSSYKDPQRARQHEARRDHAAPLYWQQLLGRFMEVRIDFPTHYDVHRHKSSTLDRLYVSLPPEAVFGISMRAYLASDPAALSDKKLSDRGILVWELSNAKDPGRRYCPIPEWICKEPLFATTFAKVVAFSRIPEDPVEAWKITKANISVAARATRDVLTREPDSSTRAPYPDARLLVLRAAARAHWREDSRALSVLVSSAPLLADVFTASEAGIALSDHAGFAAAIRAAASAVLDRGRLAAMANSCMALQRGAQAKGAFWTGRAVRAAQKAQLWRPFQSAQEVPTDEIHSYLQCRFPRLPDTQLPLPDIEDVERAARRARPAAAGPDGIPYAARARAPGATQHLHAAMLAIMGGACPPEGLNASWLQFAPKGGDTPSAAQVEREPAKTRPLALKSSGAKLMAAAAANRYLSVVAERHVPSSQRGFVKGRNFLENAWRLDAQARVAALDSPEALARRRPCLVSFDVAAAFPSLEWAWLFPARSQFGIPDSCIQLIRALYDGQHCWARIGARSFYMCLVLTGVAQGRDAELGVCADDMGIVMWDIGLLALIEPHFQAMGRLACLHLQPRKCVLVPLWLAADDLPAALQAIRAALRGLVPSWSDFDIASKAKYLGFVLGPGSDLGDSWHAAATKYKQRTAVLQTVPVPTAELITMHNGSVVSVLSYLAQLLPLPEDLIKGELDTLRRILKAPPKSFALNDLLSMGEWAPGPALKALLPAAWAAAWRTAEVTLNGWRDFAAEWQELAFELLPARTVLEGRWAAPVWTRTQSMAQYMLSVTEAAVNAPSKRLCQRRRQALAAGNAAAKDERTRAHVASQHLHPEAFHMTLGRRLRAWWPQRPLPSDLQHRWAVLQRQLACAAPGTCWAAYRTLAGAWPTSHRMHVGQPRLPCRWGCEGHADEISHYLSGCRGAWWSVCVATRSIAHACPLHRLGLGTSADYDEELHGENGLPRTVARLATLYHTYNLLRHRPGPVQPPPEVAQVLARAAAQRVQVPPLQ
ncbi:unnamed protein product, partial [Prorocentrum cordatum]